MPITRKLLRAYLNNELDAETTEEVEHWLRANTIDRDMLPEMLDPSEGVRLMASLEPEKDWMEAKKRATSRRGATLSPLLKVAASLVFVMLLGYMWHQRNQFLISETLVTIRNDGAAVKLVSLEDGSEVELNGGASITFPESFAKNRQVKLSGEAFFVVSKDNQHPFRIKTADCEVEVKGTAFNVYSDSSSVEVAVSAGVVQFRAPDKRTLTIEKDQMATYIRSGGSLTRSSTKHTNAISWRTGILAFHQAPLDQVVRDLSRYFHKDISIQRSAAAAPPQFTSQFKKPSLTEVLEEMKVVLQITYSIDNDRVLIEVDENTKY